MKTKLTEEVKRYAVRMMKQFSGSEYGHPYLGMPREVAADNKVLWNIAVRAATAYNKMDGFDWGKATQEVSGKCKTSQRLSFLIKRANSEYNSPSLQYAYCVRRDMAKRQEWPSYNATDTGVVDYAGTNATIAARRAQAMLIQYRYPGFQRRDCFTVELEFVCKTGSLMGEGQFRFQDAQNSDVEFVTDGSVTPSGENQTRPRYQEVRISCAWGKTAKLYSTCSAMRDGGGIVNRSCGLHVHLDSRHLSVQQESARRRKLVAALPWLAQMVPVSRRDNTFCVLNGVRMNGRDRRYQAINPMSFRKHGTTEIRLGSGSLDPDKILNWATVLKFVADSRGFLRTFDSFLLSSAPQHIKVWAVLRRDKFTPSVGTSQELSEV